MMTGQTPRSYGATPEVAALAFAGEHRILLGLIDEKHSVRLVGSKHMRTQWRVTLQQQFTGVDILDGTIQVVVDEKGRVLHVTNSAWPVSAVDFSGDSGESSVRASIARRFGGDDVTYNDGPRHVIYPSGNGRLAYVAYVLVGPKREPWRAIVDARTGNILEAQRLIVEEKTSPQNSATRLDPALPEQAALAPNDPCDREWVEMNAVVAPVASPEDPYYVDVYMGTPGLGEFNPQPPGTYAAGIKLLPCIDYTIELNYTVNTWGGYNTPNGRRDLFFVNANNMSWYWNLGFMPVTELFCTTKYDDTGATLPGKAWVAGGNRCGDGLLCTLTGSFQFHVMEPNNTSELYLSVGMQRVSFACPSWGTIRVKIVAQSRIFNPNPTTTLNQLFTDQDDSNGAIPCAAYDAVDLPNLTPPAAGQPWKLTGDYCNIENIQGPPNTYATARDPEFPYLRRCDMFEAVNAYYHITTNQLYLQALGYTGAASIDNRPHRVDPHGSTDDNSAYIPVPVGAGFIWFGTGGVDDAEDADVILHEYGHSIQDNQTNGLYITGGGDNGFADETRTMLEGFGDYWACSNFAAKSIASGSDPAVFGEWDHPNGWRRVDSNKIYPTNMLLVPDPEHDNGEVWSRTLWDFFQMAGKVTADKTIIDSHYLVPAGAVFSDGARALIAADAIDNGGVNKEAIVQIYLDRGIFRNVSVTATPINGVPITVSEQDVRGDFDDVTNFERAYAWGDTVHFTAPSLFAGRIFSRWDVDGVPGANGDLTAAVRMDETPFSHMAIAYYDTIPGGPGTPVRDIPKALALFQNHPNPFNPTTTITFALPRDMDIELSVFDVAGRRVATLRSGREPAGIHAVVWDGRSALGETVSSGVYIYRLRAGEAVLTRKMILLK